MEIIDTYNQLNKTHCITSVVTNDIEEICEVIDVDKGRRLVQIYNPNLTDYRYEIYKEEPDDDVAVYANGTEGTHFYTIDTNGEVSVGYTPDAFENKLMMNEIAIWEWETCEIVSKDEENNIVELKIIGDIEENYAESVGAILEDSIEFREDLNGDLLENPESKEAYDKCLDKNFYEMHLWIDLNNEMPVKSELDKTLEQQLAYYLYLDEYDEYPEKSVELVVYDPDAFEEIVLPK